MDNVAIFWDYENCPVPSNVSGFTVVNNLRTLAQPYGSVRSLKAYLGLTEQPSMPKALATRSELQSSGVSLVDCPHNGRKDVADKMIIVDMLAHAIDNPAPSTIILITGDRDFAYAISILRLRRYRIILLTLPNAHQSLTAQASICLSWYEHIIPPNVPIGSPNSYEKLVPLGPEQQDFPESDLSTSPLNALKRPAAGPTQIRPESVANCVPPTPRKKCHGAAPSIDLGQSPMANVQPQSPKSAPLKSLRDCDTSYIPPTSKAFRVFSSCSVDLGKPLVTNSQSQHQEVDTLQSRRHSIPNSIPELLPSFMFTPKGLPSQEPTAQIRGETRDNYVYTPKFEEYAPQSPLTSPEQNESSDILHEQGPYNSVGSPDHEPGTTTTNVSDMATSSSSLIHQQSAVQQLSENKAPVVPLHFEVLVQHLQQLQSKGVSRPLRSAVGFEIGKFGIYRKAGVTRFREYAAMAHRLEIVDLGGIDGHAWMSLKPIWKNAK